MFPGRHDTPARERPYAVTAAAIAIALSVGCAGRMQLPAISADDTGSHDAGRFVWYDLLTEDREGVERFYSGLLGWSFEPTADPRYSLIEHRGVPIAGVIDVKGRHKVDVSQWVALLSVADVDAATAVFKNNGGEVHVDPVDLEQRGRLAVVSDPQGALLGLLRSRGGDPPKRELDTGDFFWTELWTKDTAAAIQFYTGLAGYEHRIADIMGKPYSVLDRDQQPRAGVIENPVDGVRSHWLPYIRVDDAAALAAKVDGLGGRVLLAPEGDVRGASLAIVADPSGAAVALQVWTKES